MWNRKQQRLGVDAPKLSRKRRTPTRIEDFFGRNAAPEYASDVIFHNHRINFESLDYIINVVEDRFGQEHFRSNVKLENLLLKAAKGNVFIQEYSDIMAIHSNDFDENRF